MSLGFSTTAEAESTAWMDIGKLHQPIPTPSRPSQSAETVHRRETLLLLPVPIPVLRQGRPLVAFAAADFSLCAMPNDLQQVVGPLEELTSDKL